MMAVYDVLRCICCCVVWQYRDVGRAKAAVWQRCPAECRGGGPAWVCSLEPAERLRNVLCGMLTCLAAISMLIGSQCVCGGIEALYPVSTRDLWLASLPLHEVTSCFRRLHDELKAREAGATPPEHVWGVVRRADVRVWLATNPYRRDEKGNGYLATKVVNLHPFSQSCTFFLLLHAIERGNCFLAREKACLLSLFLSTVHACLHTLVAEQISSCNRHLRGMGAALPPPPPVRRHTIQPSHSGTAGYHTATGTQSTPARALVCPFRCRHAPTCRPYCGSTCINSGCPASSTSSAAARYFPTQGMEQAIPYRQAEAAPFVPSHLLLHFRLHCNQSYDRGRRIASSVVTWYSSEKLESTCSPTVEELFGNKDREGILVAPRSAGAERPYRDNDEVNSEETCILQYHWYVQLSAILRGCSGVGVRLLVSRQGELGSIPGRVTFGFSHLRIVLGNATGTNDGDKLYFLWTHKGVLSLLKKYKEVEYEFYLGRRRHMEIWNEIAKAVYAANSDLKVTGIQCSRKISGMKRTYWGIKETHPCPSPGTVPWLYFAIQWKRCTCYTLETTAVCETVITTVCAQLQCDQLVITDIDSVWLSCDGTLCAYMDGNI
ncbi:hypothetical protein PR048_004182 [Dryococelus australis]|uniref:Myb/SANT-like DNA-binding domain-containing protein n=1 Tax=Dryococelus australis TaxID=614101 RepID=A0ABQ9I5Y4_9NEOP|nr:hypothetical protein PR048_004182 [Dryococelus australis]